MMFTKHDDEIMPKFGLRYNMSHYKLVTTVEKYYMLYAYYVTHF